MSRRGLPAIGTIVGAVITLVVIPACSKSLFAQATATANQGITGSATDPTGAAVPGATITARNISTGVEFTTTTGSGGYFAFPELVVGTYRISVTKTGFSTAVREKVTILAGLTPNVDFQLSLGSTAQTVEVTGETGTVDKTTTVQGETIPTEALQELPVIANGGTRSTLDYLAVFGGVSQNTINASGRGGNAGVQWSNIDGVGDFGGYGDNVSYKVDGIDQATDQTQPFGGNFAFIKMPPPSDIQEVRLMTNLDADEGFNMGVTYELITKSGADHYHGEAFEYARNNAFDARNFISATVPPERQHDFGVSFGGAIPRTHKKSFFFVTYEGYRSGYSALSAILTVPTAAMRQGDFSQILGTEIGPDTAGNPVFQGEIFDPNSAVPDGHGGFERSPISGTFSSPTNIIPASRLSKVSQFFQNGYPMPNLPGTTNNYEASALPDNTVQDKIYIKTDHDINDRQRLSLAFEDFFRNGTPGTCGNVLEGAANYEGFSNIINNCSTLAQPYKAARINYTFSIRPDLLLAFDAGLAFDPFGESLAPQGLTSGCAAGLIGLYTCGTPIVNIANFTGWGQEQNKFVGDEYSDPVDFAMTWMKGTHELKFGAQFDQINYVPVAESFSNGDYSFDAGGTNQPDFTLGTPAIYPGSGYADYLLGWVDGASLQSPFAIRTTTQQWAVFAQDRWRATPKLTLSYGLRWELYVPSHESYNRYSNFCPSCPNPGAGNIPGALQFLGTGAGRIGRTTFMNLYPLGFEPRLGAAYAVSKATVARLYFGVTRYPLNVVQVNGGYYPNNGFGADISQSTTNGGITPVFTSWDTTGFVQPQLPDLDPAFSNGQSIGYYDYNDNRAHPSMDVGVQVDHQLSNGFMFSVKYGGKFMHGLPTNNLVTLNQLPLADLSLGLLLNENVTSPAAQAANIQIPYAGFRGTVAQALRPYPQYQTVNENDALAKNSYWNAVILTAQQRYHNGLTLMVNWTLSKILSNDANVWGGQGGASFGDSVQHTSLRGKVPLMEPVFVVDTGGSRPSVLNIIFNYELPYGRGKHFGTNSNHLADGVLGGWNVAGLLTYGSGVPEEIGATGGGGPTIHAWAVATGAPLAGTSSCSSYDPGNTNSRYLNPAAFTNPPAFQLGDTLEETGRRSCGIANVNFSLGKTIKVGEGRSFKFGADSSNLFNNHTWQFLNTSVGTTSFGRFGSVLPGRAIQLHGEFIF